MNKGFFKIFTTIVAISLSSVFVNADDNYDSSKYNQASEECSTKTDSQVGEDSDNWFTVFESCMKTKGFEVENTGEINEDEGANDNSQ